MHTVPHPRKPDMAFSHHVSPTSSSKPLKLEASKRPALPAKEYEEATDQVKACNTLGRG